MKIKLIKDIFDAENEKAYIAGTILEVSDEYASELIEAKKAEEHKINKAVKVVEEAEEKALEDIVEEKVEEKAEEVVKEIVKEEKVKEVKDMPTVEVVKDAPIWKSAGEFYTAVIKASRGNVDGRLLKSTGQNETTAADGGYLIQHDLLKGDIMAMAAQKSVLMPKCTKMEIGPYSNGIKIPQVNESSRDATTLFGGVRIYSPEEGVAKTPFQQAFTQKDISLDKLTAVVYCTDELLQDAVAMESWLDSQVDNAFAWVMDDEIMNATLGSTTAIVGHASTVAVTVAGSNPTAAEWKNIYRAVAPTHRTKAEWYMSNSQWSSLLTLADGGSNSIYQPNYAAAPAGTLLGRPINVMEQCGADATASSILFGDASSYLVISKGGMKKDVSIHVKFLEDESCFRYVVRFGGSPMIASKITDRDNIIVGPFATRNTA